jgi:hypothetical protein
MKRKASTSTLVMALLLSSAAGALSVNLANANPVHLFPFPNEPLMNSPTIIVHSPIENQIYNSNDVWLNFTIIKPETWFVFNAAYKLENGQRQPVHDTFGNITSVCYIVDEGECQNIPVHDVTSLFDAPPTLTLNFSTLLQLTEGVHTAKASLKADSYYVIRYDYSSNPFSSVALHADSETVTFTVEENPFQELTSTAESNPFPTRLVATAFIATMVLASTGSLVYFKKHKRRLL